MAISQADVRFKVPSISKMNELFLPDVTFYGMQWKIKVLKKNNLLGAYMYCGSKDIVDNWSHTVQCTFKILSSKKSYVKMSEPFVFDSSRISWGFSSLIDWNTLCDQGNGYVENDAFDLDVSVEAVNPNDANQSRLVFKNSYNSCEQNCRAVFQLMIENVGHLMAVKTPLFNKKCMPWTLTVFKDRDHGLSVRLDSNQKCTKTVHIKLVPLVQSTNSNAEVETKCIRPSGKIQVETLIPWTELLKPDNGFVENNSIQICVEVTADGISQVIQDSKSMIYLECAICFDNIQDKDISSVRCGHQFCTLCIGQYVKDHGACPSCQTQAVENDLRRMYLPISN